MNLIWRIESLINGFFFKLRQLLKFTRKKYNEKPELDMEWEDDDRKRLLPVLEEYKVRFEEFLNYGNSVESYHHLDLLHQARQVFHWNPKAQQKILDVGSKNFYYARALSEFFRPRHLIGVELDAYKMYRDFHTRYSYAQYYLKHCSQPTEYLAIDFLEYNESVDMITWFLPFVLPYPLVKWSLPLSELKPVELFQHAHKILKNGGELFMLNQNPDEWKVAEPLMKSVGFSLVGSFALKDSFLKRESVGTVSLWRKEE